MKKVLITLLILLVGTSVIINAKATSNKEIEETKQQTTPNATKKGRKAANTLKQNLRQTMPTDGVFTLIELPYPTDALEPVISKQTIELHYGKHLKGYVDKLNTLVKSSDYKGASLEEIVASADGALFNNAGQTLNHNLYFTQFSPSAKRLSNGKLYRAICDKWGSEDNFRKVFTDAGTEIFGSGWVWLAANEKGELFIEKMTNGSNPIANGLIPLLGFDVWEHAYYLDYQNRRRDHIDALWQIVNWPTIEERYKEIINK